MLCGLVAAQQPLPGPRHPPPTPLRPCVGGGSWALSHTPPPPPPSPSPAAVPAPFGAAAAFAAATARAPRPRGGFRGAACTLLGSGGEGVGGVGVGVGVLESTALGRRESGGGGGTGGSGWCGWRSWWGRRRPTAGQGPPPALLLVGRRGGVDPIQARGGRPLFPPRGTPPLVLQASAGGPC